MATKPSHEKQVVGGPTMSSQKAQTKTQAALLPQQYQQSPEKRTVHLQKQATAGTAGDPNNQQILNGKQNELPTPHAPQQRNSGQIQTYQPQQHSGQTRILINPQTYQQHQKEFTIDKQEYQSVFRMIDKDNQGHITIEQVNCYLDKFEQLHREHLIKKHHQETIAQPKQTQANKTTAQLGYQRVRISNGPTPIKQHKQNSLPQQQQNIGSHLLNSAEPQSSTSISQQKSQERNVQRRINQQQVDIKQGNKVNNNTSNTTQNQSQTNGSGTGSQNNKVVNGTPIFAQNKSSQKTPTQNSGNGHNTNSAENSNSYGQQPTAVSGSKVQTERVQKWNELAGAQSNITTASTSGKQVVSGLQASKTSFKLQNGESPVKRPSQSGMDPQQQKPDSGGAGSNLQLKLVQVNSPGVRTNNSRTSSATESGTQNQVQIPQQTIDTSAVTKFPNGKPTLEFEEFIEVIRESCTDPEGAENYLVHAFSMFDIEKKGYINSQDLKLVFELLDESVTDEELATMIKIASLKSSDRINFKAFVDFFYKAD